MIELEKKYSIKEVMEILGRPRTTIYTWIKDNKIKAYKQVNRYFIYGKDLKEFAEANHFDI